MRLPPVITITSAIVLLLSGHLRAATEIPFEFRDGMVWVKVAASGKAGALNFLLDSGASASVLDLQAARRLGVELGAAQSVQGVHSRCVAYKVDRFAGEMGGVAVPKRMLALDLSAVSAGCHQRIDGLIGADFFRGRIVQIDFAAEKVRLLSRGELNPAGCEALPIAARNDAMCVRVAIDGEPAGWMRVDTGCNSALQWAPAADKMRRLSSASIGLAPGSVRHLSTEVQLGSRRFEGVQTGIHWRQIFPCEAGLLGNGVLSKFTVTFDMQSRRLLLAGRY